jgi:hypothetical protein
MNLPFSAKSAARGATISSLFERLTASGLAPEHARLLEDMPSRRVIVEPRRPFREPGVARDEVMFVRSGLLSKYKTDGNGRR